MQNIKKNIFYAIVTSFALQSQRAHAAEIVATKVSKATAGQVVEKTIEAMAAAGPYVSVVLQAYNMGQEIRKFNLPTEEERAHALSVNEKYVLLTAEKELQSCLIKNRSTTERGHSGIPTVCQEITCLQDLRISSINRLI